MLLGEIVAYGMDRKYSVEQQTSKESPNGPEVAEDVDVEGPLDLGICALLNGHPADNSGVVHQNLTYRKSLIRRPKQSIGNGYFLCTLNDKD